MISPLSWPGIARLRRAVPVMTSGEGAERPAVAEQRAGYLFPMSKMRTLKVRLGDHARFLCAP